VGETLSRGRPVAVLAGAGNETARLRVGLSLNGRTLDPQQYLLPN
jgi:hypothetical protein